MSMMIFGILFFSGIFLMFVFILFGQEKLAKQVRLELAEQRALVTILTQRVESLEQGGTFASGSLPVDENVMRGHVHQNPKASPTTTASASSAILADMPLSTPSAKLSFDNEAPSPVLGQTPTLKEKNDLDLFLAPPQR